MLRLWIVTSSLFVSAIWADVNFYFDKTCYSEQENIKLTAEYKGSGTVTAVQWYYSNKTVSNLIILASNCLIAGGSVPPGYPDESRITSSCDLATKTFTLTLKGLQAEELKKSWGATFSLSADPSPDVKQETISICSSTIPPSTTPPPTTAPITSPPSTTPPSTTTKSPDKKITVYIIVACVGVVAFVGISILACCLLRKWNNRKKKNGAVPEPIDTKDMYSLGSKM